MTFEEFYRESFEQLNMAKEQLLGIVYEKEKMVENE